MTIRVQPMSGEELAGLAPPDERAGLGALTTERGNLPLDEIAVSARITGLTARTELTQSFVNPHSVPLEATYIFPLPDRAAVTAMRMEADDRVVEAVLAERQQAREQYDQAIRSGRRASIAEEERPDVFTMRVGNIMPGERVRVRLTLAGLVPYEDGAATYRFPLVVAPRYIPGTPLDDSVGAGVEPDTDAVPDASRITPPVLLPGFPNPVRLGITVTLDPAGLPVGGIRSSLHHVEVTEAAGVSEIRVAPGERPDRDFVLRWSLPTGADQVGRSLVLVPDDDGGQGTFHLTLLPPELPETAVPRDVVLVLDRSGSMSGWKMVAARRAAARIVDSLSGADRFAVLGFDNVVERPADLGEGLVAATDRHRFRAVEFLAGLRARGGTELLAPMRDALSLLADPTRDRVLVLVTDGQVGNEDQILSELAGPLAAVRVHTVGIDRAVNAGFLGRLAVAGGGRCELVESEDRLDEAMERIHRRIATPLVTGLRVASDDVAIEAGSVSPARLPDLFAGAPLRIMGRYAGPATGPVTVTGQQPDGTRFDTTVTPSVSHNTAVPKVWARARLRDLEDRYVATSAPDDRNRLEQTILELSLRFGVLCRFTAFVAVDNRVVNPEGTPHQVVQPVEPASGWTMLSAASPMPPAGPPAPGGGGMMRGAALAPAAIGLAGRPRTAAPAGRRAADLRSLIGTELRRLVEAADAPGPRRWNALADLGSRLRALADQKGTEELVRLGEALRECDGPLPSDEVLERLWRRVLEVLERFREGQSSASGSAGPGAPAGGTGRAPGRSRAGGAFWKRP